MFRFLKPSQIFLHVLPKLIVGVLHELFWNFLLVPLPISFRHLFYILNVIIHLILPTLSNQQTHCQYPSLLNHFWISAGLSVEVLAIEWRYHISFPNSLGWLFNFIVWICLFSYLFSCRQQFVQYFELTCQKIASLWCHRIHFQRAVFSDWKIIRSFHALFFYFQTFFEGIEELSISALPNFFYLYCWKSASLSILHTFHALELSWFHNWFHRGCLWKCWCFSESIR